MTALDWTIVAFALFMGMWGFRQGLIVGFLTLGGFLAGALLGGRLAPALLAGGSESPYAPMTALAGAILIGGIVAVSLEGFAHALRGRVLRGDGWVVLDALGGAVLLAILGVALAWLFGVVALNAPGAGGLREAVQRSLILRGLNGAVPPSGALLNTLNRIDPGRSIEGPEAVVAAPDAGIAADPEVRGAERAVARVTGTACGLGVEGSGWLAAPGLVVTNAHVVAGQEDTVVSVGGGPEREATPVHYDPANDLALLRVQGAGGAPLPFAGAAPRGTAAAVLGYPEDGPFAISPARLDETETVISQDSYGRGPIRRELTAFRGEVRSGNSGGPIVDAAGRVVATVFASTAGRRAGGYGVPSALVAAAIEGSVREVSTGPCT